LKTLRDVPRGSILPRRECALLEMTGKLYWSIFCGSNRELTNSSLINWNNRIVAREQNGGRKMTYHGVIRGKTIELDEAPWLPEGLGVTIEIIPFRPGEGIRASAGAWADAGPELDKWLKRMDDARHSPGVTSST
jgi:hypothetical protein